MHAKGPRFEICPLDVPLLFIFFFYSLFFRQPTLPLVDGSVLAFRFKFAAYFQENLPEFISEDHNADEEFFKLLQFDLSVLEESLASDTCVKLRKLLDVKNVLVNEYAGEIRSKINDMTE